MKELCHRAYLVCSGSRHLRCQIGYLHNMKFVPLQYFTNYIDAHIVLGRLQEEGINCWLKDENTVTTNPIWTHALGGIKLMVAESQLARATQLLQQLDDDKRERFVCPRCGSGNIELVTSPKKPKNFFSILSSFFLASYPVAISKEYHCFNCSNDFEEPQDKQVEE